MSRQIQDVQNESRQRIKELEGELSQCRKRDAAFDEVRMNAFLKEQRSAQKERELEKREARIETGSESQELAHRARELDAREVRLGGEEERMKSRKKELDRVKTDFESKEAALEAIAPTTQQNPTVVEDGKIKAGIRVLFAGNTDSLFKVTDAAKFATYRLPLSFEDMQGHHVDLLRRHDYYKGWMDCTRVAGHLELVEQGHIAASGVPHLYDTMHRKNPNCAGANAGALFTWAALCQGRKPEWNVRLDDRCYTLKSMAIPQLQKDKPFWVGWATGEKYARVRFREELERTGDNIS